MAKKNGETPSLTTEEVLAAAGLSPDGTPMAVEAPVVDEPAPVAPAEEAQTGSPAVEEPVPASAKKPANKKQRFDITPATRLIEFIETVEKQSWGLKKTKSPEDGKNAYEYLLARAQVGLSDGSDDVQHRFVNELYSNLTMANTVKLTSSLTFELRGCDPNEKADMVLWARDVLARSNSSVEWIREAEKALRELRYFKTEDRLSRALGFWEYNLDESVSQAPVDAARKALEAMEAYKGDKPGEMSRLTREGNVALKNVNAFEPVCGCGCGEKLTRKNTADGKKGKFHKSCYKSFRTAHPAEDKHTAELKEAAAEWGVNYIPASEAKPDESFIPKPMGRKRRGGGSPKVEESKGRPQPDEPSAFQAIADGLAEMAEDGVDD